ncbi:hypothetical protein ECAE60S_02016 [Eoetvoesiella caeni]
MARKSVLVILIISLCHFFEVSIESDKFPSMHVPLRKQQ